MGCGSLKRISFKVVHWFRWRRCRTFVEYLLYILLSSYIWFLLVNKRIRENYTYEILSAVSTKCRLGQRSKIYKQKDGRFASSLKMDKNFQVWRLAHYINMKNKCVKFKCYILSDRFHPNRSEQVFTQLP